MLLVRLSFRLHAVKYSCAVVELAFAWKEVLTMGGNSTQFTRAYREGAPNFIQLPSTFFQSEAQVGNGCTFPTKQWLFSLLRVRVSQFDVRQKDCDRVMDYGVRPAAVAAWCHACYIFYL